MNKNINGTYIMVWIEEEEKWYYFMGECDFSQFITTGYVDYYVEVKNGIITKDTYKNDNIGKNFEDVYLTSDKPKIISVINGVNIVYEDEFLILSDVKCKECGNLLKYGEVIDGHECCESCRNIKVYNVYLFDRNNYPSTTEFITTFSTPEKAKDYVDSHKKDYDKFQELYFEEIEVN